MAPNIGNAKDNIGIFELLRKFVFVVVFPVFTLLYCMAASAEDDTATAAKAALAAGWISAEGLNGQEESVLHFRKTLRIEKVPTEFSVQVSADNRYRLSVNGKLVGAGPQRADIMHWKYDEIDLAPYLRKGSNVITALVWNWGQYRPITQHSFRTGFLLRGKTEKENSINSNDSWKVLVNSGHSFRSVPEAEVGGYYAAAPAEVIRSKDYPHGWREVAFDDKSWSQAITLDIPVNYRATAPYGVAKSWQLQPATLPQMEESFTRFKEVRRTQGREAISIADGNSLVEGSGSVQVPANSTVSLLLDQSVLTNAYLVINTSQGAGSKIEVTYAESLKDKLGKKLNRNEIDGKTISGVQDTFYPAGGDQQKLQTLWFRNYRYVQLDITTADSPLTLNDIHGIFTGYPFELKASFDSELPWIKDIWEINWRATRLCAFDMYFDTPYYEQLQYVGDTRVQALLSYYQTGDDRLARQAIKSIQNSTIAEGITASRAPSYEPQYIPPFSLIWVLMVHDFWMHREASDLVQESMPTTRTVIAWFERRMGDAGLLTSIPWWPFVDWNDDWDKGIPPGGLEGDSVMISLQFAYTLQKAAELEATFGSVAESERYLELASTIVNSVRKLAWDDDQKLFSDTPSGESFSQQTNTMAVLVGAVPKNDQKAFMQRVLSDSTITQSGYYYLYYVHEALQVAGLGDNYISQLGPWQDMIARGLTTTPEYPDPTRSDSHAWSAHPNYHLLATVVGVRPSSQGFKTVKIEPKLGDLTQVEAAVPHPYGMITVSIVKAVDGGWRINIDLPENLSGEFVWNSKHHSIGPGENSLQLK